jgi:hypothetical protein
MGSFLSRSFYLSMLCPSYPSSHTPTYLLGTCTTNLCLSIQTRNLFEIPRIEMDTGRRGLSQVLGRMSNVARERAPIAAEFEDCSQRFDRLSSVMEANELTWEPYQILLNNYRSRLATWGSDTGARSRTIDYTLRKSSRLQSQALDLLEHLHESLQNSM